MLGTPRETTTAFPAWTDAETRAWEWLGGRVAVAIALLAALAATLGLGLQGAQLADWVTEARPSVDALLGGHFGLFLQRAPAYGGSLLLRAPFMELVRPWAGDSTVVYLAGAVPCVAALIALGIWLSGRLAKLDHGRVARAATVAICIANPITISALQQGHPEELLGAALCVAAVLCAQRDRATWSGVLVGVAIANKPWGVLAAGPVLIALPRHRVRAVVGMVAVAGLILAPFTLVRSSALVGQTRAVGLTTGWIFNPQQVWWFFGSPNGAEFGGRVSPVWLHGLGHTLPLAVMPPLSFGYALLARRRPALRQRDALLLLALLLFLRCVLDPWDVVYYPAPFLIALIAWETTTYDRPPILAGLASLATWWVFVGTRYVLGENANRFAIVFSVAAIVALVAIGRRLFVPAPAASEPAPVGGSPPRPGGPAIRRRRLPLRRRRGKRIHTRRPRRRSGSPP